MSTHDAIGRRTWLIAAGRMPLLSHGEEPRFTSHDKICLLNAGTQLANVRIMVLYEDFGEVGPFRLGVAPHRIRHVRINDLIFPEAVRLDVAYGLHLRSDKPIVVQFSHMDTRAAANAALMALAWPDNG